LTLIRAQEYRNAREEINQQQKKSSQVDLENEMKIQELKKEIKKQDKALKRKKMKSSLSFMTNEEEEELEGIGVGDTIGEGEINLPLKKKIAKNPDVDTSHLPDRERDERLKQEKERLTQEWLAEQEIMKNQVSSPLVTHRLTLSCELPLKMVEVVYSYWDGTGHRKAIEVKKGCTIGQFLSFVKVQLSDEFPEIRNISPEDMMYVKEDLIIPQVPPSTPSFLPSSHLPKHISFYDLIITRARGKSGPLFHFDVHDDVRYNLSSLFCP
jgi:protein FAM50